MSNYWKGNDTWTRLMLNVIGSSYGENYNYKIRNSYDDLVEYFDGSLAMKMREAVINIEGLGRLKVIAVTFQHKLGTIVFECNKLESME